MMTQPLLENREGFILPLSMLLVIVLGISGTAFMHHDYLERRMAMNTVDNHGGFYLANAGIERARETLKIDTSVTAPDWSPVLTGTFPYAPDPDGDSRLCPDFPAKKCVIPVFGATVVAPGLPFDAAFSQGSYSVRVQNDAAEFDDTDMNGIITVRALGTIRGEQKLLQADVRAVAGLRLVNCDEEAPGSPCPEDFTGNPKDSFRNLDGRDPKSTPELPTLKPGLYNDPAFFVFWTQKLPPPPLIRPSNIFVCGSGPNDIDCSGTTISITVQDDSFYRIEGLTDPAQTTVNLDASGNKQDVVVFSEASIEVQGNVKFMRNTVLTSERDIQLKGSVEIHAPTSPMYPAIVAGGSVGGDQGVTVFGNVYAAGTIELQPITIHGLLVGANVNLQGSSTIITDDGNLAYYELMPGFTYPPELLTTVFAPGRTWRELQ